MNRSDKHSHCDQPRAIDPSSKGHTDGPPAAPASWHEVSRSVSEQRGSSRKDQVESEPFTESSPDQPSPGSIRLQKVMAQAGVGSRRHCEQLIRDGDVAINGRVIQTLPVWVHPHRDQIVVNGRRIASQQAPVYIMLYKPRGVVSTTSDDEGRRCVTDLVRHKSRLYPVGRLDKESSGLLLLTNDGPLASRLTHPRHGVTKTYEVMVRGTLDQKALKRIRRGVFLTSKSKRKRLPREKTEKSGKVGITKTKPAIIKVLKQSRDRTALRIQLREGKNRQIRRILAQLGHPVQRLKRIQIGPLKLSDLRPGQWRELDPREVEQLHRSARIDVNADR